MAVVQMECLEKGQRIAEYEVLKLIARGPCGATYQVAQRKTGKEFALKLMQLIPSLGIEWKQGVYAQTALLNQIKGRHIDSILFTGETEDFIYWVKDFVHDPEGHSSSLLQYRQRYANRLSQHQLLHILHQTLLGLEQIWSYRDAHHEGLCHGNIKASNILLLEVGDGFNGQEPFEVKLTDLEPYGLRTDSFYKAYAKHLQSQSHYAEAWRGEDALDQTLLKQFSLFDLQAPEEKKVSFSADLFALGVTFYSAMSGQPPQGRFLFPTELRPELDPFWDTFIKKTLAYKPEERFSSYSEIREHLDPLLGESKVEALPAPVRKERRRSLTPPGMVYIPAGNFSVGSYDCGKDATPPHECSSEGFYLDRTPVTNAQFQRFVEETGYQTEMEQAGCGPIFLNGQWKELEGIHWQNPLGLALPKDFSQHPVVQISYQDALAYCAHYGRRLPSEEEWEYAAKGGLKDPRYPWGHTITRAQANYGSQSPCAVMSYQANAYGLYDIVGNVWEWTSSWYQAYPGNDEQQEYYGEQYRVLRGGAWQFDASQCMISYRNANAPDASFPTIGFRTAYDYQGPE